MSELSKAAQARELVNGRHYGVLSTAFHKSSGHPYGSIAPYVADEQGRPVFMFATLATHYRNLQLDPRASLTVFDPAMETDPMDSARVTLIGTAREVPEAEQASAQELYLTRFPDAKDYLEIGFVFFRLEIELLHWIGGFGGAGWPTVSEYREAVS